MTEWYNSGEGELSLHFFAKTYNPQNSMYTSFRILNPKILHPFLYHMLSDHYTQFRWCTSAEDFLIKQMMTLSGTVSLK